MSPPRPRFLRTLLATASCLVASMAFAAQPASLRAELEAARAEMDAPGLRAALRYADGTVVEAAVGVADLESGEPLTESIGMPGGSTGKTFYATLTMVLIEEGVLGLDDPASKWLGGESWFARLPNREAILVRHLLSHSSGLADYPGSWRFQFAMVSRALRRGSAYFTPEELIGYGARRGADFAPGDGYRYTDAGYLVLGRVIEAATGQSVFELLREKILGPIGIDGVRTAEDPVLPDIANGYSRGAAVLKPDGRMRFDPRSEWTGGGLVVTPAALVEFLAALASGRIVEPGSFELMLASGYRDPARPGWHYGFGVFVDEDGSGFGHQGLWPGYRTAMRHDLASGVSVAVQANRDGEIDLGGLARRLASGAGARIQGMQGENQ